jgi:CheY-like chemotaxis protein
MKKEVIILIAEDDEGHATLIKKNLKRAGLLNEIKHFKDGQEILDFLFGNGKNNTKQKDIGYLLLLDIRMPKIDGEEVLKRIKENKELHKIPVIMITTTDDPREVEKCHALGCNNYITKPVDYDKFVEAIRQLGLFLLVIQVPQISGD